MPRNSTGVYSLPQQPFFAGSNIIASQINSNYSDLASTITNTLASTGVTSMRVQLVGFQGELTNLSYTFNDDITTGWYLSSPDMITYVAAGEPIFAWNVNAFIVNPAKQLNLQNLFIDGVGNQGFGAGTSTIFMQTNAPVGWVKSTAHNNKILKTTNNSVGSGGTVSFTDLFRATVTINASLSPYALTVSNLPSHRHFLALDVEDGGSDTPIAANRVIYVGLGPSGNQRYRLGGSNNTNNPTLGRTSGTGSGQTHTHNFSVDSLNLDLAYVDVIVAVKDV